MLVKDILNRKGSEVYSVHPQESVYDAIKKMSDLNIGALLVMEENELTGIISERDYRNKIILMGRTSSTTPVKDIMVSEVIVVNSSDNIETCMQLMSREKIRHLPVVDSGRVIGVVSIGDVLKSLIDEQEVEINSLRTYISGDYPA
ncbi:MAG: CBS domain-containing protein [Balneolaceae bacterium]|nr:CBS domain-containing protein [Balneolaceae bacterium]MCH8548201.1 CBS domain-containing protein [Balneolaceae bacterium]